MDVTQSDEKDLIKDRIAEKMMSQHEKDIAEEKQGSKYAADEYGIPYNLVFEDDGKLVVGINIEKAQEFNRDYSTGDQLRVLVQCTRSWPYRIFPMGSGGIQSRSLIRLFSFYEQR